MATPTVPPAELKNVQGDIVLGFSKKLETSIFFQITNVTAFRKQLALLIPLITSGDKVAQDREAIKKHKESKAGGLLKISGFNIAFSQFGLNELGINDDIGDSGFKSGQLADAQSLNDKGKNTSTGFVPNWIPAFKNAVHGVIILAGDSQKTIDEIYNDIKPILKVGSKDASIREVLHLHGSVRPKDQSGHEHFGYLDGISNPAVENIDTKPFPGQQTIRQGIVLLGRNGDPIQRPEWALDGSFLAFRYLFQLVPEFDDFLWENALPVGDRQKGSDLLGARFVGRWKSGTPVVNFPTQDDPSVGKDPQRNNDFQYDTKEDITTQDRCPFAAHIRKTNPRHDLEGLGVSVEPFRIVRRGIPFGPEVTRDEKEQKVTLHSRGLLFRCYQSDLSKGFQFLQKSWADNTTFPPQKPQEPGFDPIIGQAADPTSRTMTGADPQAQSTPLPLPDEWVVSKGGEYFFSPSIPALKTRFAVQG